MARQIQREFGDLELVLYGPENLPICFYMGRTLPYFESRRELDQALREPPDLTIIWEQQNNDDVPPPGREKLRIQMRKRDIVIYQVK